MTPFTEHLPTLDNRWRAVILFGRNVSSYKFAMGRVLLDAATGGKTFLPLSELALPYARHIAAHLRLADRRATSPSSRFLDACRQFNRGELSEEKLAEVTERLGFNNVLDAFHVVGRGEVGVRFFHEERTAPGQGVRLTDELFRLAELHQHRNLPHEVEARWRLVETAWQLDVPVSALCVAYDEAEEALVALAGGRRTSVTDCRDALNGYQKGRCFYCFADVSVASCEADLADVDHFLPHRLEAAGALRGLGGIWNLVLACQPCNRGAGGQFDSVPRARYLERLHARNEFLIASHHPLRETLMNQTGATEAARRGFLQGLYREAAGLLIHHWAPADEREPAF